MDQEGCSELIFSKVKNESEIAFVRDKFKSFLSENDETVLNNIVIKKCTSFAQNFSMVSIV